MSCKIIQWDTEKPIIHVKPDMGGLNYIMDNNLLWLKIQGTDTEYDNITMIGEV